MSSFTVLFTADRETQLKAVDGKSVNGEKLSAVSDA